MDSSPSQSHPVRIVLEAGRVAARLQAHEVLDAVGEAEDVLRDLLGDTSPLAVEKITKALERLQGCAWKHRHGIAYPGIGDVLAASLQTMERGLRLSLSLSAGREGDPGASA